jgi:hypothetical protein
MQVVGIRLSQQVLDLADSLIVHVAKDINRYPGTSPSRSDVLRQAMVMGLKAMEEEKQDSE